MGCSIRLYVPPTGVSLISRSSCTGCSATAPAFIFLQKSMNQGRDVASSQVRTSTLHLSYVLTQQKKKNKKKNETALPVTQVQ